MKRAIVGVTVVLCALALAAGCTTSSYQSAKMLPQGTTRVTAALSNYHASVDGNDFGEPSYEVMAMHGLNDQMEIGGKISYVNFSEPFGGNDANLFQILAIPKFSLIPGEVAVVVPAGVMTSDEDNMNNAYEINPGIVYSRQLNPDFELDATGHTLVVINDEFDDTAHYIGANIGLQLSPGGAAWALHPEFGLLIPVGDDASSGGEIDYFFHFGIGFHYRFGVVTTAAPDPSMAEPEASASL